MDSAARGTLSLLVAAVRPWLYGSTVLRRGVSLLALLALIATPAGTSTRFFWRYTGEEIVGCDEAGAPKKAEIREEECCQQRTFRAVVGVRPFEDQRERVAAPVAIDAAPVLVTSVFADASPALQLASAPPFRPPAFLSHRALLI